MQYSDIYLRRDVQIPTWLSLSIIVVVLFVVTVVFFRNEPPSSRATKKTVQHMEITNWSSSQVAIFWQTEQKEPGWIAYGTQEKNLNKIAIDERDFQEKKALRRTHYAILKSLNPSTTYFFKLVNNKEIIADSKGLPFTFTTVPRISQVSNLKPAYGKITDLNGAPLNNIIVLLSVQNSHMLSALSKASGEWLIPLNYILDKKSGFLKILSKNEPIQIEFFSEVGEHSTVQTNISNLSPLTETIVLGKDYNLNKQENVLSASNTRVTKVDILFPKENAVIPGSNPLIRGTGVPNVEISATISNAKKDLTAKTKIGGDGSWSINLNETLTTGKHTLTVRTPDTDGKEKILSRNFSIAKSGEQVLGEATGAATPTASPSSTLTTATPPVSGGNLSLVIFSSLSLITIGLWLLVIAL